MARKIIWSPLAQRKRIQILRFWIEHNKSTSYSKKLNLLFKQATVLISEHPNIGRKTDIEGIRVKVVRGYLLFYEFNESDLYILTIWDSRQHPDKLRLK